MPQPYTNAYEPQSHTFLTRALPTVGMVGHRIPPQSTGPVESVGSNPNLPCGPMRGRQSAEVACDVEGHILHRICLVTVRLFSSLLSCLWPTTSSNKHSSLLSQPFCIPFVPLVASPAHTLLFGNLTFSRTPIAGSSPLFPASLRLASHHDHRACTECSPILWPFLFCPPSLLWCSVCEAWGSWGRLKLCRCVCVSISVLIVFIAYEVEHLRQGLRVRVLN